MAQPYTLKERDEALKILRKEFGARINTAAIDALPTAVPFVTILEATQKFCRTNNIAIARQNSVSQALIVKSDYQRYIDTVSFYARMAAGH